MKNADYFSQFITEENFEHYVNRKRSDKCYGNNIEMQAMAEMYNRTIEVYQYSTGTSTCLGIRSYSFPPFGFLLILDIHVYTSSNN